MLFSIDFWFCCCTIRLLEFLDILWAYFFLNFFILMSFFFLGTFVRNDLTLKINSLFFVYLCFKRLRWDWCFPLEVLILVWLAFWAFRGFFHALSFSYQSPWSLALMVLEAETNAFDSVRYLATMWFGNAPVVVSTLAQHLYKTCITQVFCLLRFFHSMFIKLFLRCGFFLFFNLRLCQ